MDNKLDKWWDHITYADAKKCIRENIQSLARDYIAIGFYLRRVRDEKLYLEDGYAGVHEFAYEEFGMRKSTVNHCIRINTEFSEGGNSPVIDARYKEFGRTQLQELLYVPEDKRDEATPDMTVAEIRKIHKPERLDNEPEEKEKERLINEPEQNGDPGRKKAAADVSGKESEYRGRTDIPVADTVDASAFPEVIKKPAGMQEETAVNPENIPDPELDAIDTQYREETVEITAQGLLDRKQKELDEWMEATEQDGDAVIPPGVEELRIIVQALEILAGQQESYYEGTGTGDEVHGQPPLPALKNNEQRKEWLSKYQEWGLWYEDGNIGAKYYRYRFENGAELIVEEYQGHGEYVGDYTTSYCHLVGGPDAPRKSHGLCGWQRHEKYNKFPNSETELVEFLKFVQKGDK